MDGYIQDIKNIEDAIVDDAKFPVVENKKVKSVVNTHLKSLKL